MKEPVCFNDWSEKTNLIAEINIDLTQDASGGLVVFKKEITEEIKNLTSSAEYQRYSDNQVILLIILSCFQNISFKEYSAIFNESVYILHDVSHTFDNIVYIKNNYRIEVILEFSNETSSQNLHIPPGGFKSISLGNQALTDAETQLKFTLHTSEETLSKNVTFILKEMLLGLHVEYRDLVEIGKEYNFTATVFSGSNVNFYYSILSPSYNKPWIKDIQSVNQMKNNKMAQVSFTASFESNYTILVEARSNCGENLSQFINITAAFPEICHRNEIDTELNMAEFLSIQNYSYKPVCIQDWDYNQITVTEINFDITDTDTSGFVIVRSETTGGIQNFNSQAQYLNSGDKKDFVVIILSCFQNIRQQNFKNLFKDKIYILHNISHSSDNLIYVKNNYTIEVFLEFSNDTSSQNILIQPGGLEIINLGKCMLYKETILTFKINATKDLQIKELSLIYQEMLSGFNIDYKESMFIDKEYNITASVLSGSNVTMNFSIISPADDNAMTRNQFKRNSDNEKNFQFKFRPILETNYTIHMVAESFCEEVLMQDIKISAVPGICHRIERELNMADFLSIQNYSFKPVCIQDWTGDQTTVTQIYLDLTNDDKSGFITVTNDSIEIPIQKSGDTKDFMMIVLSCFQNIKSQSYKTMFQNRIYILDNINQTSDNIIYIKNNYTVEVFLEFSNDTSLQNILLQPGGLEVINLQQSVYYNETLLTFKVNTTEAFHSKELSLIYKEMLTGFDVNYKESVLINKEYNITATVLSGSNVTINFSILSPADDNSLTKNLLTSNSENEKNAQFLFRPRFDTNYTILMAAKSYCEEVLEQVIRISVAYPEMCPMPVNKNLKIVTDTLLDPHNKPVCVKDWFDDKHFITEIHMDLITDDFDGYVLVKNDSTELVQHLTTIGNYQNMENNQTILVIILSCFQNNEHQGNEIFNKSIYLLHNVSNTHDIIIYVKNDYLVEVFLDLSCETNSQTTLLPPGCLHSINLGSSIFYNAPIQLNFTVNATKKFLSRNLNLIHKEILSGLNMEYKASVLIGKEYNITATLFSGSNVNINFSISPANDDALKRNLEASNVNNDKIFHFTFEPKLETNYTISVAAEYICEDVLTEIIKISAKFPEMCFFNENGKVSNMTGIFTDVTYKQPVCVKDWNDKQAVLTEIFLDLTHGIDYGFVLVQNDSTKAVEFLISHFKNQHPEDNLAVLMIVLSCFRNMEQQEYESVFNETVYILHNISQTNDSIIYIRNDYLVDVFLETSSKNILIPSGGITFINLINVISDAQTKLSFKINATREFSSRNLSLIHKEILSDLDIEYRNAVLIWEEYYINATVLSGSNLIINASILSPIDDVLMRYSEVSSKSVKFLFKPRIETNYTISIVAGSMCGENLTRVITISATFPVLCQTYGNETVLNKTEILADSYFKPVCCNDWDDQKTVFTQIYLDVSTGAEYGILIVHNDTTEAWQFLTSHAKYQNPGDNQAFVMIVLSCFQNMNHQEYKPVFNDTIYILHNFNQTYDIIIYVRNDYLVDVYLETNSQIILILPGGLDFINLGNSIAYNAQIKLSFLVNATKEFHSRNLSLNYKEILSGLYVDYPDAVLIGNEYNITATLFSGSNVNINFSILSPVGINALTRTFWTTSNMSNDKTAESLFIPDYESNYTILVEAISFCEEHVTRVIIVSVVFPEICVKNESSSYVNFSTLDHANEPFCLSDWSEAHTSVSEIYIDFTDASGAFLFAKNDTVELKSWTSQATYNFSRDSHVILTVFLSCFQNIYNERFVAVFSERIYLLHNISKLFDSIICIKNDYPLEVILEFSNETKSQTTIIAPGETDFINLGNYVTYTGQTQFIFKVRNNNTGFLTRKLTLIYKETLFGLDVEYRDAVVIGQEYNITAAVFSGSNLNINFSILSPVDNKAIARGLWTLDLANKISQIQFRPRLETNYSLFVIVKSFCEENINTTIQLSSVFPEMCPRHENKTASNVTDILANHSDIHKDACITDLDNQSSYIAEINIDLTSDSNGGIVFVKNVSSEVLKNLSGSAHCENPGEVPMIVVIVLTCTETFRTGSKDETAVNEFNETVFMLQNINTNCERVLYFQNNYLAEVRLRISDASSQDLIIEPNSLNSIILNSSVLYDYTNLTFSLRTSKESHITNISLKYEALQDLEIYYNSSVLVGDVHNITASAISGSVVDFSFKVISLDDTSAAYIKKNEAILGVKSWIQFTAFQELNFTIEVEAKSVCGENITKFIVISAVYPDLCIYNETSMSQSKSMANSKPSCMMDLSEYNRTATQIYMDLTSEERTSYAIISNYSMDIFNNITSSLTCNSSTTRENFLLFNIILSCPQSFYEPVSIGENGETIYILQTIKNICGHGFYIINSYNDTQVKVINGSISLAKNVLPEKFITTPIKDAIILTFNLTYHKKLYNKNITLKFHEVMTDLTIQYDSEMLVGIPHNVTALVSTGTEISFDFEILSSDNNELMTKNSFTVTKTEDKIAVLEFTPNFVGAHIVAVTARSFCMEKFNKTVNFVSQLCSNGTSALDLSNNKSNSPLCIVSWGDNPSIITEFTMDLQLKGPIGYKYQINTTTNFTLSTECKGKKGVAFKIILNCFSISLNGVDDSSWFNSDIYIKKGITYPSCEELAVIYNNYTINISVQYTVLSQNLTTQQLILPPKSFTNITLVASFSSVSLKFSMLFAKQPLIKNLTLIHFDELSGLSVSFVSEVEVGSIWNITASMASGAGINFTLLISTPENSISTEVNNYTIHYINNKTAQLSYIPPVDGKYNITVVATSMCGEVLSKTVSIFAYYSIQYSELDTLFEITHRKDQGVFYPKDIVGIAFKVMDKVLRDKRPTLPNCTIHWGDESRAILEENVDLTPNPSTGYIYVRNHSYTSLGQYTVSVECHNAISKVEGIENFTIVSPVIHADVVLLKSLVPFDNSTSHGIGTVQLIQKYLEKDCPDFTITLDFGVSGSNSVTFLKDYFIYTYNYSEKGEYDIRVEIGAFGVNKTFNFSIRVGYLMMFKHVKQRKLIRIKEPATFKLVRYPLNETLDVEINMDDESQIIKNQFDIGQTTIDITIMYMNEARRIAVAKIIVDTYTEVEIYTFDTLIPCISTLDFFDATYRDTSSPLEAWLTTLPIISGRAERTVDCNFTHILSMHWEVSKKNDSVADNWSSMIFDQPNAIVLNFNFIKAIGLYKIHLQISVNRKNETESDTMYLIVTYPPLSVKIKYGAFKQIRLNNNITLDGKSETKDLAEIYVKNTTFRYEWACYLLSSKNDIHKYTMSLKNNMSLVNLTRCSISLNQTEGIIIVPTLKFALNDLALFLVTVKKDERSGIAGQVAEMCDFAPVDVIIECLWNCGEKLVTDERTVLEAKILNADIKDIKTAQYSWSVSKYGLAGFENVNTTNYFGTDREIFDTDGGWWEEGVTYSISVEVTMDHYNTSKAIRMVFTNFKPYGGNCSVEPLEGIATETSFMFKFPGWKDEGIASEQNSTQDSNFGLQYKVHQKTSAGFHLVYAGNEVSATTYLTECTKEAFGDCQVLIYVIDMFGAKVSCNLTVKVHYNVQSQLISDSTLFFSVVDKKLNSSLMMGDSMKIAQRAATLSAYVSTAKNDASLNNSTAATTTTVAPLTSSKEEIVNRSNSYVDVVGVLVENNTRSSGQIQILANSLAIVTSGIELMTTKSMETASGALKTLTKSLTNIPVELSSLLPCLDGLKDLVDNIVEVQHLESKKLYSYLNKNYDGYTAEQTQKLIEMEEKALKAEEHVKLQQFENIVKNVTTAWDDYFQVVKKMADSDGKYETEKENFKIAMQKVTIENILNQTSLTPPLGFTFDGTSDTVNYKDLLDKVHVKVVKTKNIYTHGFNAKHINTDIIIGSVQHENGTKLNLTSPKIFHNSNDTSCDKLALVHPTLIEDDASQMFYHKFEYKEIFLHFCLQIRPVDPLMSYKLYLRMDLEPTDLEFDYSEKLTSEHFIACNGICFEPGAFKKTGTIYIGLYPVLEMNETVNQDRLRKKRAAISNRLEAPYYFGITSAACFSWNRNTQDWDTSKCKLTNLTGTAACSCEHGLEVVSGMSFNLFPNTIHFATVFSKFDIKGQGLVIGVLLGLYLLFTLISLWAHYMDRKAMFQWGVFPLVDNYAYDNYFYLITVHTGLRKSAGTTSNVNFTLSGESVDSGIRKLSDGVKKGFPAGSVCHFVMACSASLGELQCIKIWHDSSGLGSNSSWYLDRIDVVDLQTGKIFFFICDEWLAPEYGIVKMVEASNVEDLEKLKNLFFSNTKDHITDDHMWVSLFIRPEKSNFSRVERAVCCLAFLLLSMITSAMFYKDVPGVDRKQAKADFEMGFIRISFEQLYHSLVSAVITAIPMIFVMMVFRKARHIKKEGGYCCNRKKDDIERKQKTYGVQEPGLITVKKKTSFTLPWMAKLEKQLEALEKILLISPTSHNLHETWPHQFRYFAWVILISAIVTSSFFILLYSMEWGKDITETWMSTFFLTFLQSLFVVDPIKVIAISIIVSIILRKAKVKNVDQLDLQLIAQVNKQYGVKEKFSQLDMSYAPPLTKTELRAATLKRKIHIMINTLLKEFIIHFVYLIIVASLCHASRSPGDYQMYNVINKQLITDPKDGFLKINSTTEFLKWIPETLTPWLFPNIEEQKNYFPDSTFYTNVKDLYRFGTPRIRQLRMMKGNCSTQKIKLKDCVPVYSFTEEETGNYCSGWKRECSSGKQADFTNAWIYRKPQDIWGLPIAGEYGLYNGGGYIAVLHRKDKIDQIYEDLKKHAWIDRQTRAVFIELTLYCPNINHFIFIILLAEFIETGAVIPFFSMYPFTVHYPPGMMGTYLQLCQIVGTIFTFIACIYVVFIISKKKCSALKDFWFLLDLAAVLTAISAAAMMFLRLKFTNLILSKIKEDRAQFVNMYHVVVWDWAYTLCLAILIAIGCLRLLKLASYSETTMKVYLVLSKAIAILPNFCIFIILILLSFVFFGWITFGPTSTYFKSFWSTTETMFTGILGRSSFKDTNSPVSDRWINIIFFCLFVWIVVIFLINFFLAVLMNLLKDYEQNLAKGENTKVFILLWDTFMKMMGSKRNPLDRLKQEEKDDEISDSEEEISVIPVDKTISLFEKRFIKLCQHDDEHLIQLAISRNKDDYSKLNQVLHDMVSK